MLFSDRFLLRFKDVSTEVRDAESRIRAVKRKGVCRNKKMTRCNTFFSQSRMRSLFLICWLSRDANVDAFYAAWPAAILGRNTPSSLLASSSSLRSSAIHIACLYIDSISQTLSLASIALA